MTTRRGFAGSPVARRLEPGDRAAKVWYLPGVMWVFLIPVILLAGATFAGSAAQMVTAKPPAAAPPRAASSAGGLNGPLPFDPPSRER